jgi:phage head maturation protease
MGKTYLPENVGLQASYPINWAAVNETRVGAWASSKPWQPVISGLIPWGIRAESKDNHGTRNQFAVNAFTWGSNVKLLIDHEGQPLASLARGNLRIYNEPRGLRWEAEPEDCPEFWELVMPALEHRLGCSPGFIPKLYSSWGADMRDHMQAELLEISLTCWPGFEATKRFIKVDTLRLLETAGAPDHLQELWARREMFNRYWR